MTQFDHKLLKIYLSWELKFPLRTKDHIQEDIDTIIMHIQI